jgi:hypothetical protein
MKDFTSKVYITLLEKMKEQDFSFQTFADYVDKPKDKSVVIRHDVDDRKEHSLQFAKIQHKMGIAGTYYFRIVPQSFDEKVIKEIAGLGHEIGYHYETMDTISKKTKVIDYDLLVDTAYEEFCRNLEIFRKIVRIITICMHGSPLSKYDNRAIWGKYDYKKLGIIADPYIDVDFDDVFYLTDTGRRWDGDAVSIRDKGIGIRNKGLGEKRSTTLHTAHRIPFPKFHSTFDIIKAAEEGRLPDKIMMTFHPQRWTNKRMPWMKELVWQNVKNVGKNFLIRVRS